MRRSPGLTLVGDDAQRSRPDGLGLGRAAAMLDVTPEVMATAYRMSAEIADWLNGHAASHGIEAVELDRHPPDRHRRHRVGGRASPRRAGSASGGRTSPASTHRDVWSHKGVEYDAVVVDPAGHATERGVPRRVTRRPRAGGRRPRGRLTLAGRPSPVAGRRWPVAVDAGGRRDVSTISDDRQGCPDGGLGGGPSGCVRRRAPDRGSSRTWGYALAALLAVAFAIRVLYIVGWHDPTSFPVDGWYYHLAANGLADGNGFSNPLQQALLDMPGVDAGSIHLYPGADHPPGFGALLSVTSFLGLRGALAHQVWCAVMGTVTVLLIGLIGRRLAGNRAGLVAAGIAAVYPALWSTDAYLAVETPGTMFCALAVVLTYRLLDRPTPWRAVALGAVIGLAALTRSELIMLVALLAVPAVLIRGGSIRRRLVSAGLAVAATLAVVLPWVAWTSSQTEYLVPISTSSGALLAGSNCPSVLSGPDIGGWNYVCAVRGSKPGEDPTIVDRRARQAGLDDLRDNLDRLPVVTLARLGRTYGIFHPMASHQGDVGREPLVAAAMLVSYWVLAAGAVVGAVVLRRRRVPLWPLLSLVALSFLITVSSYGNVRFRAPAEIAIVVLAAVAVDQVLARRGGRAATASDSGRSPDDVGSDHAPSDVPSTVGAQPSGRTHQ